MSRHEGVSCDSCLKSNFTGRRYKCLICYDYDLCADCYEEGVTSTRHLVDHPMQCILTRSDIELFFGGEMLNSEQPQSFTCPYCKKMGFSDATLLEHVSSEHTETSLEVVCPVCAGLPGGEPNLVTDDFAGHLSLEHRTGPRELISFLDEPSAIRHGGGVRRIPGRTLGGPRARRSNMHFSSSSGLSALSPSGRESVDPIAELLSQLSGVRRGGPPTSQLQQLQMQIQLERQQATRQQLERLPRRAHPLVSSSNSNATMAEVISGATGSGSSSSGGGGGLISGSGGNANGGGGSGSCRTNEWSVSAQHQSQQSSLAANALNTREVTLNSSNYLTFNDFGLSPQYSSSLQPGGSGISGSNGNSVLGMTIGGSGSGANAGSSAGAAGSGGNGADGAQSQFLLTKFMQPTLSDAEWAEIGRERADRSQFVQALLLSTLSCSSLELEDDHEKRAESQETTNSDNVNNEKAAAAAAVANSNNTNTANDSENYVDNDVRETMMNNNAADASAQTTNTTNSGGGAGSGRQQVHQQQQTSPEDFVVEDLKQQQQQAYSSKKKVANSAAGIKPTSGGGVGVTNATSDRGGIERRGRPPPSSAGGAVACATGSTQSSQQQQQGQQPQKYKQNAAAAAAMSAANTNQIPDTR
ncbi:potassium channel modulatory factor 1 isoform 2-T4 [Cochliomyia hominivorax]